LLDTVRAFIAIDLPEDVRRRLRRQIDVLQDGFDGVSVRWVRPEAIHLTLRFLGETRVERVADLGKGLKGLTSEHTTFSIKVGGLGCFPNIRRPRVVWVGVQDDSGTLKRLQSQVEAMCRGFDFPAEQRGFSPHLTLGRVRRGAEADAGAELARFVGTQEGESLGSAQVDEVILFQSELKPEGAVYRRLAVARLGLGR
jgi:RNA 2',3'-cyclic 3'-phosphodiesterase